METPRISETLTENPDPEAHKQDGQTYAAFVDHIKQKLKLEGNTVLITDDAPFFRKLVSRAIRKASPAATIVEAENGADALLKLEQIRRDTGRDPLFIVTDLEMPVMDGWALLAELRKRYQAEGRARGVPVIVLSATDGQAGGLFDRRVIGRGKCDYSPLIAVAKENCTDTSRYDAVGEAGLLAWVEHLLPGSGTGGEDAEPEHDETVGADLSDAETEAEEPRAATPETSPFGRLVREARISSERLRHFEKLASRARVSVGHLLVTGAGVPLEEVGACLAEHYGVPFVPYDPDIRIPAALLGEFEPEYLEHWRWLPLKRSADRAVVLIDDPHDSCRIEEIKSALGVSSCELRVALLEDITRFLRSFGTHQENRCPPKVATLDDVIAQLGDGNTTPRSSGAEVTELLDENAPGVVHLVNRLLADAIHNGASDVHIDPGTGSEPALARFRIDGVCRDILRIPASHLRAVVARIKVMSDMNIAEKRMPQDGKMTVRLGETDHELRVATLPTVNGEAAVLRVLPAGDPKGIDELNLAERNRERLLELLTRPHGIVLVVGPTGSGKTTTLHALLGHLNTPDRKIWTAEDPVEITQPRMQQIQVNQKIGLTFAALLRAFLRADPDVILIGEMRDSETAHAGIEASLTGHLVLSTLHTNSAPETLTRLLEIGLDPFSFADALVGVLAQRLVRTLCPECKEPYEPGEEELSALVHEYGEAYVSELNIDPRDLHLYRPVGCDACAGTGYAGRTGIHELLADSDPLRKLIVQRRPVAEFRHAAMQEGMRTLRQDGITKILCGHTDLVQVRKSCAG